MTKVPIKSKLRYPDTRAEKSSQASANFTTKPSTSGRRAGVKPGRRIETNNSLDPNDRIPTRPGKFKKRGGLFTAGTVKRERRA